MYKSQVFENEKDNISNHDKPTIVNHKKSNSMLTIDLQKIKKGPQIESFFKKD